MDNVGNELNQYAQTLLSETTSPQQKRSSVHALHQLFVSLGAINSLEDPVDLPDHLQLPSGRAIAPRQAGLCLLEPLRTSVFAAGLKDAIGDLLQQLPGKTIRVLDAGCGPYALLPLLAASFYTPQQVQFTLLDIFEQNLASAKTLISNLGMMDYFSGFILTDATTYISPCDAIPDIVISETMNKALEKEPQAAITLKLAAQLPPHGILLPKNISVTLQKINSSLQQKALAITESNMPNHSEFEAGLGMIITLDKNSTLAGITQRPLCSITIPGDYDEAIHKLQYFTTITVYKNHLLQRSDCSLTLPLNVEPYGKKSIRAGDTLDFYYTMHPVPRIECSNCNGLMQ
jgi:hypothetical protein